MGSPIYEGEGVVVWNKPAGLCTSGKTLDDPDCLQFKLMQRYGTMVWAVHQLDADTSGVNVFTTDKAAVRRMQLRMRSPVGTKRYLAVVHGVPAWDATVVQQPIGMIDDRSLGVLPEGKRAETHFRVLHRGAEHALLEARLLTGRTHQIRIHLQHLNLSLVGEYWYRETPCRVHHRQALHAWKLDFADDQSPASLTAPLAADLVSLGQRLLGPLDY